MRAEYRGSLRATFYPLQRSSGSDVDYEIGYITEAGREFPVHKSLRNLPLHLRSVDPYLILNPIDSVVP